MGRADEDDIHALYEDILECLDFTPEALKNVLRLALEAEYHVGYEDGYVDGTNEEVAFQLGG